MKTTLKELEIGDRFYPASALRNGTASPYFEVYSNAEFNSRYGSYTRMCINLKTKKVVSKSCGLEIIRLGNK